MPATQAKGSFGAKLKVGDGASPEVFTAIAEVGDISGPNVEAILEEATNHDSTDGFVEVVPTGVKQVGDITFTINQTNATTQEALLTDIQSGAKKNYRLELTTLGKKIDFAAYVKSISQAAPVKGKMMQNIALTVTGKFTKSDLA